MVYLCGNRRSTSPKNIHLLNWLQEQFTLAKNHWSKRFHCIRNKFVPGGPRCALCRENKNTGMVQYSADRTRFIVGSSPSVQVSVIPTDSNDISEIIMNAPHSNNDHTVIRLIYNADGLMWWDKWRCAYGEIGCSWTLEGTKNVL